MLFFVWWKLKKYCIFTKTKTNIMAYIKISDRNLKNVEVKIISRNLGLHTAIVREDRRNRYISDYILFNKLTGTPYMIKEI